MNGRGQMTITAALTMAMMIAHPPTIITRTPRYYVLIKDTEHMGLCVTSICFHFSRPSFFCFFDGLILCFFYDELFLRRGGEGGESLVKMTWAEYSK